MKVSVEAIRQFVDIDETPEALGAMLTMAGLELDALEPAAPAFERVVVARILTAGPHPDADRLRVCQVEVDAAGGPDQLLTIVCGAPNARAGLRVPCAMIGAELPGGLTIKRSKIRGVESFGMLCSGRELGLGDDHSGLLELPDDAPVGASLREVLLLDDAILELGLTPNRADCLSVLGVAREIAAITGRTLRAPACPEVLTEVAASPTVERVAQAECPVYCARVVEGLDPAAKSPLWLRERLRRAGLRSVSVPVDVTNLVLYELGQPLHAFDAHTLEGGLTVRHARAGERLALLDEREITLAEQDLVIADARGPVALAGIMGGAVSAVSEATTAVVLESAHFTPRAIAGRARAHGLHTDASHRFERGVDPALPLIAIERATELLMQLAGGRAGPVVMSGEVAATHRESPITLRRGRVDAVLGTSGLDAEVERVLQRLGCRVEADGAAGWRVWAPSYRFDLSIEADLIEEMARLTGYDRLPSRLASDVAPITDRRTRTEQDLRARLVAQGFSEVVTFSFQAPDAVERLYPGVPGERLLNPISAELSVMRPGLWPGLIEAARLNASRGQHDLAIFELGQCFDGQGEALRIVERVGGLARGRVDPAHFDQTGHGERYDFLAVKGAIEPLLDALDGVSFVAAEHPALHPGQSARIEQAGQAIGWIGALHPAHAEALELDGVVLWTLDLETLLATTPTPFRSLSAFPAVSRDLAVVVHDSTPVGEMLAAVRTAGVETLESIELFDVFRGAALGPDRKSVAFRLIFRDFGRTLEEGDAMRGTAAVEAVLADGFGAVRRG